MGRTNRQCLVLAAIAGMTVVFGLVDAGIQLFGPHHLLLSVRHNSIYSLIGTAGLVCSVVHLASVRRGGRTALSDFYPHLNRLRICFGALFFLVGLIIAGSLIGLFASSRGDGVIDGMQPIVALQDEYRLNNHGTVTLVSRSRYLAVGASFVIGYRTMFLLFPLLSLHAAVLRSWMHSPAGKRETN